jgi:hypothetical protein
VLLGLLATTERRRSGKTSHTDACSDVRARSSVG